MNALGHLRRSYSARPSAARVQVHAAVMVVLEVLEERTADRSQCRLTAPRAAPPPRAALLRRGPGHHLQDIAMPEPVAERLLEPNTSRA